MQFSVEAHDPSPGGYISKVVWDLESIQDKAEASQSQADAPVHVYRRPYNSYVAAVTVTSALGKDTWMALEPVQTTPAHYPFAPMVVDAHTLAILRPSSLASGIVLRDPHIGGKPVAGATIGTWGSPALSNDNLLWMKQRSGFSVAFKDANDSVSFRLPRSYSALASNATLSVALKMFVHAAAPSGLPGQPIGTGHSGDAGSGIALNILAGFTQDWQRYFAVAAGEWDKTGPWLELNSPQNPAHDKSTRLLTATNLSRAMPYGSWYQVEFALTPTSSSYYVNGALVARSCEFAQFFDASKPMNLTFGSFNGPVQSEIRAPLFVARTLNAVGQSRVTLSLRQERLRAACGLRQEERGLKCVQKRRSQVCGRRDDLNSRPGATGSWCTIVPPTATAASSSASSTGSASRATSRTTSRTSGLCVALRTLQLKHNPGVQRGRQPDCLPEDSLQGSRRELHARC